LRVDEYCNHGSIVVLLTLQNYLWLGTGVEYEQYAFLTEQQDLIGGHIGQ
jgi:hypothetical protein